MEIKVSENVSSTPCEVLVTGKFEDEKTSVELANKYAVDKDHFEGRFCETYLMHTLGQIPADKILIVGLGKKEEFDANKMREAVAKSVKKLQQIKAKNACFDFDVNADYGKSAAIGALIADYAFDKYKNKKADRVDEITFAKFSEKEVNEGIVFANAMKLTRDLANESAQVMTPSKLADTAKNLEGITTQIYDRDEIERMGMGAFLAVGQGSVNPPKFIHMKYTGKNVKKKIALIGKGICFDSGGLDIKPASSMLTMRDDMSGAACVLGVMKALSALEPDMEVHGIIAACENMPSGSAQRPGDVVKAASGKTIEVVSTDAEGRMVLADAVWYACRLGAAKVIDIATLTGGVIVALGNETAGIVGNNEELIEKIMSCGKKAGEMYWHLPSLPECKEAIKSDIADLTNSAGRAASTITGGLFIGEFIDEGTPWAHLDIGGTSTADKTAGFKPKGCTAFGVRTFVNIAKEL